jgi:hypothetical protein
MFASRNQNRLTIAVKETKHSSNPLKRFGTVLGRRRQSTHPYSQASSEPKSSSNLGSFGGFGKGKSKDREVPGSSDRPGSPLRHIAETPHSPEPESPNHTRGSSIETPNGAAHDTPLEASTSRTSNGVNGTVHDSIPELVEPLAPPPVEETKSEVHISTHSHHAVQN